MKITPNWKQLICLSIGKWLTIWCSINAMKQYSETRTDELLIHTITWVNLKNTTLSGKKKLYTKKVYTVWFHICTVLEQAKLLYYENIRRADASQRWRWRLAGKGREGTFWNDGNVLYFDRSLGQNWENGAFKVCTYIRFTSKKKKKLNGKWKLVNKMYAEAFQGNTDICI